MSKFNYRLLGESIALIGVILSLIFVGLELRQSTIAARAAAYQELGIATSEIWFKMAADRETNHLVFIDNPLEVYLNFSESEKINNNIFTVGVLRLYETVYLQVEQGLLDPSALNSLGWNGYTQSPVLREQWPDAKQYVDEGFASYLESTFLQAK